MMNINDIYEVLRRPAITAGLLIIAYMLLLPVLKSIGRKQRGYQVIRDEKDANKSEQHEKESGNELHTF